MVDIFINYHQSIFSGILTTLLLLFITTLIGIITSMSFAAIKYYKIIGAEQCVNVVIFFIRGTPFLVQLFIIYYGPLQFHWLAHSWVGIPLKSATFCALLALILNTTAYASNLFYGAMKHLPKEELLAAKALGLGHWHSFTQIIFPRIMMIVFPTYTSEVIMILKCTALVSTITVLDTMGVLQQIMTETYQTIPCLLIAAGIYLLLTIILTTTMRWVHQRIYLSDSAR